MKKHLVITGLLAGGLAGCSQSTDRPIDSIISLGMPFREASSSLDREGLDEYVFSLPRDSQDLKRYRFTEDYSLVLLLEFAPLHEGSDIAQEVVGKISLVPTRIREDNERFPINVYGVDLNGKDFR